MPVCTQVYGMHARHQSPSARSADGVDIVIVKDDPGVCQRVNVGGGDLIGAMETDIIPTLMIKSLKKS